MAAGQKLVGTGHGETHEVLHQIADALRRLVITYLKETEMRCYIQAFVRWIDTKTMDVRHSR